MSEAQLLVSFCNTVPGAPALALIGVESGRVRVPRVPPDLAIGKASGLALSDRFLFVVTTRTDGAARPSLDPPNPSRLFVFDRRSLALLSTHDCSSVLDAHSLHLESTGVDTHLHVVSTGTDEVVRLTLRGPRVVSEDVVWRVDPDGARADIHHLNAIGPWRGELVISGFGRRSDLTWSSAQDGFISSIATGERLASGIEQPHSLIDLDGALVYCQSATRTVHVLGAGASQHLPGYPRGMARVGDQLFVGTSRGRQVSKSTGRLTNRADPGAPAGKCTVVCLTADTLDIRRVVDLDHLAIEIYDLLPVSGTDGWPLLTDTEWRDELIASLTASFEVRDATIAWLHTEVSDRDATVTWLHQEVAERDRSVASLHQEVAARDRVIEALRARIGIDTVDAT